MKRSILITGGAGFIGSRTAALLVARGHRVRVLDTLDPLVHGEGRMPPPSLGPDVELVVGDVRDREALDRALVGVDAVLHLAALTGVSHSMFEVRRYVDTNVGGTASLWDAIANGRFPVERVVLGSSRAVYGEGSAVCEPCGREVLARERTRDRLARGAWDATCPECGSEVRPVATRETAPARPLSIYADTKHFQERLSRTAAGTYAISLVVLRYFNVFGGGQSLLNPYTGILPSFACRMAAGRPVAIYEDGAIVRDFIHVDDVAAANALALEGEGDPGEALNVGSGQPVTVLELARVLCVAMGVEERFEFTGQFRAGDVRSCFADISRAEEALEWRPRIGLEEGTREFAAWFVRRGPVDGGYDEAVRRLESNGLIARSTGGSSQ